MRGAHTIDSVQLATDELEGADRSDTSGYKLNHRHSSRKEPQISWLLALAVFFPSLFPPLKRMTINKIERKSWNKKMIQLHQTKAARRWIEERLPPHDIIIFYISS